MDSPQNSPTTASPVRKRQRCRERTNTELNKSNKQTNDSIADHKITFIEWYRTFVRSLYDLVSQDTNMHGHTHTEL